MGLVTGPHARTPCTHSQWVVGPGCTIERTSGRVWESARPRTPHTQARGAPPRGTLVPPRQRAKPPRKSARFGVGYGSPRPDPPHPQPVGSGPRPHAPKDGRSGVGERPIPDAQAKGAPPPGIIMPPPQRAKPARKSARGGVGDGSPRPHFPTRSQWIVSPGRTPERTSGREWERPDHGRPTPRQEASPPGALAPPPQRAKPARKSARCGVGDGSPRPHLRTHSQWVVGPGRTPERTSRRGWESARPRPPHTQARGAPPTAREASSQERARWGL